MSHLVKRWTRPPIGRGVYTRQGVYKLTHSAGFPEPAITSGRVRLWRAADIAVFEVAHPELTDDAIKHRKVIGYAIGNFKKRAKQGPGALPGPG
jgi:hypothetical protein